MWNVCRDVKLRGWAFIYIIYVWLQGAKPRTPRRDVVRLTQSEFFVVLRIYSFVYSFGYSFEHFSATFRCASMDIFWTSLSLRFRSYSTWLSRWIRLQGTPLIHSYLWFCMKGNSSRWITLLILSNLVCVCVRACYMLLAAEGCTERPMLRTATPPWCFRVVHRLRYLFSTTVFPFTCLFPWHFFPLTSLSFHGPLARPLDSVFMTSLALGIFFSVDMFFFFMFFPLFRKSCPCFLV